MQSNRVGATVEEITGYYIGEMEKAWPLGKWPGQHVGGRGLFDPQVPQGFTVGVLL